MLASIATMVEDSAWDRLAAYWGRKDEMTNKAVAAELGVSYQAARKIRLGGGISLENAQAYAKNRKVDPQWLVTGSGERLKPDQRPQRVSEPPAVYSAAPASAKEAEFVSVQRADVSFSNGTGQVVYHEDGKPPLVFRMDFLRRLGIAQGDAVVVDAEGWSNEPKIVDGSVVLVNRGDRERLDGSFFAFRFDGELLIKRLERIEGVGILATAENSNFKPKSKVYHHTDEGSFEVIGKAVWMGSML